MSTFCDFVPDDPSCKTDPVDPVDPVDPDPSGGEAPDPSGGETDPSKDDNKQEQSMDDHKGGMTWEEFDEKAGEYFDPWAGNLAYLSIAVGFVTDIALKLFLWHADNAATLSQAASGSGNTDYYDLLHKIEGYGGLGIWGLAALTQLLATFGIMVSINMLVWGMLLPLVEGLLEITIMVLGFMAYNQFWDQYEANNSTAASYLAAMERETATHTAKHIAAHFEMYHEAHNWLWAAYMNSSDEAKEEWRKDKEFLMMLELTPEKVEEWGMKGKKDMDMKMEDKKMMDGPPSLILRMVNL